MITMTMAMAPQTPPGMPVSACWMVSSPPSPRKVRLNSAAPIKITKTMEVTCAVERTTSRRICRFHTRTREIRMPHSTTAVSSPASAMPSISRPGMSVRVTRRSMTEVRTSTAIRLKAAR